MAVEVTGNWYWIVDEIEQAGLQPRLVHARKVKVMSGCINKTDRSDVRGVNWLQWVGTLPTVMSLPGVGFLLAVVISLEVGDVGRFATCERLAAYAGTTPRVHASEGKCAMDHSAVM